MNLRNLTSKSALGWLLAAAALLAVLGLLTVQGTFSSLKLASAGSAMTKEEFERRVRDYLLEHPEVLSEAMQRLEERERAAHAAAARAVLKDRADEILRDPASPVGGNAQGDVTIVEFFDYNCPYCRRMTPLLAKVEAGDAKLRVVYKELPILGPTSMVAAKAALAAERQGKYVSFHKALMAAKDTLTEDAIFDAAGNVGLDLPRLKTDMTDSAIQAALDRNRELAEALQITGTPAFAIGEQLVPGGTDIATLERLIREAREKK